MENEPGPVEVLRNVVGGLADVWAFLVIMAIGIALVVMGNTLAQLIGAGVFVFLASLGHPRREAMARGGRAGKELMERLLRD